MSPSKPVWGSFKRNAWDSRSPPSHSAKISTGFYSQKLWGQLFLALEPWAEAPHAGLGPLLPQWEPPQLRYPSHGTSLFHISTPPMNLMWLLLYFLSGRNV